jgi:hypothetical protein
MELKKYLSEIENDNSLFLAGNGFSINFDSDFNSIYSKLHSAHKEVIYKSEAVFKGGKPFNKKAKDNYKNVLSYVRNYKEDNFVKLFEDAYKFAVSIECNANLKVMLEKYITRLTFGVSQFSVLEAIVSAGRDSFEDVNIENWTILIFFYYAICDLKCTEYSFPENNEFITLLKQGDKSKVKLTNNNDKLFLEQIVLNGLTLYYRLLFAVAVLNNEKAISLNKLDRLEDRNLIRLGNLLNKYTVLTTLNYDHLLELISNRSVEHFHGSFKLNKQEFVYYQSLMYKGENMIELSDILIGDYFTFKVQLPVLNSMSSKNRDGINTDVEGISQKFDRIILDNQISNITIFGVNVENDYHVLRQFMISLFMAKINNPKITYFYYHDIEKEEFEETFKRVITYSEELSEYSRNIDRRYISSKELVKDCF